MSSVRRRAFNDQGLPVDSFDAEDISKQRRSVRSQTPLDRVTAIWDEKKWLAPALLTVVALWTHLYRIGEAQYVVWDEAHFGKFSNYYRLHTFYTDLHPNLGKSLLGFPGWLFGYPGAQNFDFGSEQRYPAGVGYVVTRIFCGLLGAAMTPLAYYTCKALGCSSWGSFLGGLVILSDTALTCITRFILLDPILLFFTSLSIFALARFRNYRDRPFTSSWWGYLALTGFSLGCVASVKWIGLFTVAVVGIYTIADLWNLMGDQKVSNPTYIKHWIARILLLIVLPFSVYALVFYIHFAVLYKSGPGDAQMHPLFQADLLGNYEKLITQQPRAVAYGSQVTLHSVGPWGALLHSHVQTYPKKEAGGHGSGQQQVTGYHHFDDNNNFRFERRWGKTPEEKEQLKNAKGRIEYVRDGDIVRLVHWNTKKNIHSHRIKAPLSLYAYEVSGYGSDESDNADPNDEWQIQIMSDVDPNPPRQDGYGNHSNPVLRPITTKFRLRHVQTGCHMSYHNVILPQWGFKQYEIVCRREDPNSLGSVIEWAVERINDPRLPLSPPSETSKIKIPSRLSLKEFARYFYGVNIGMHATNNLLTPEPDKPPSDMESDPDQWPMGGVSMRMSGWGEHNVRYMLIGNVVIWRGGVVALLLIGGLTALYTVGWRRGWTGGDAWFPSLTDKEYGDFVFAGVGIVLVGWLMHFVPFFTVKRVTYLHHYLPALYYAALGLAFSVDHLLTKYVKFAIIRRSVFIALSVVVFAVFWHFRDTAMGMTGPTQGYQHRKWLSSWRF